MYKLTLRQTSQICVYKSHLRQPPEPNAGTEQELSQEKEIHLINVEINGIILRVEKVNTPRKADEQSKTKIAAHQATTVVQMSEIQMHSTDKERMGEGEHMCFPRDCAVILEL